MSTGHETGLNIDSISDSASLESQQIANSKRSSFDKDFIILIFLTVLLAILNIVVASYTAYLLLRHRIKLRKPEEPTLTKSSEQVFLNIVSGVPTLVNKSGRSGIISKSSEPESAAVKISATTSMDSEASLPSPKTGLNIERTVKSLFACGKKSDSAVVTYRSTDSAMSNAIAKIGHRRKKELDKPEKSSESIDKSKKSIESVAKQKLSKETVTLLKRSIESVAKSESPEEKSSPESPKIAAPKENSTPTSIAKQLEEIPTGPDISISLSKDSKDGEGPSLSCMEPTNAKQY